MMKTRSIVYSKSHGKGIRGISVNSKGSYTRWYRLFLLWRRITGTREFLQPAVLDAFKRHPATPRLQRMLVQYGSDWLRQQGERVVCIGGSGVKTLRLDDWLGAAEAEIARRMNRATSAPSPAPSALRDAEAAQDQHSRAEDSLAAGAPVQSTRLSVRSGRSGDHSNLYNKNNPHAERHDAQ
jgi:hypothetical protein